MFSILSSSLREKSFSFGCALYFHNLAWAGHYHVHIHVGAVILFGAEVKNHFPARYSDAHCREIIFQREATDDFFFLEFFKREAQGDEAAVDWRRARAAVGFLWRRSQ